MNPHIQIKKRVHPLFKKTTNGIFIFNKNQEIIYANKNAAYLLGYTSIKNLQIKKVKELINKKITKTFENNRISEKNFPPLRVLNGESNPSKTYYIYRKNKRIWLTFKSNKINFKDLEEVYITFIEDITYYMEEEMRRITAIGSISHDIKNILANIKAFNELVGLKINNPNENREKIKRYINKVDTNINVMTRLINDMMDAAKLKMGKLELRKEKVNFKEFIIETLKSIEPTTNNHKIILKGNIKNSIKIDKNRINQVILNLVSNAVKYSSLNKNIVIVLKEDSNFITVEIKDKGKGIPNKYKDFIFKPYYRVDDKNTKGVGLGLFIAKELIRKHEGNLWFTSKLNKGTTFSFTLPKK